MILDAFDDPRPFAGQDPHVVAFEGAWLLVQSSRRDRRIVVRAFTDLDDPHRGTETTIWAPGRRSDHGRQIWAPELHEIDGRWYVHYSASDGANANHRSYVLVADHPLGPYREVGRVADSLHDCWAIDLTVVPIEDRLFAVWSGWGDDGDPTVQHLYIASMSDPCTISGVRRRISSPELPWERSVADVNEGPQALTDPATGRLFLTYSADASWTSAYKVGALEWLGDDPLRATSWRKHAAPLLEGGGHGCFVDAADGPRFVYHRKLGIEPGWADRVLCTAPLTWTEGGLPCIGAPPREAAVVASRPMGAPAFV